MPSRAPAFVAAVLVLVLSSFAVPASAASGTSCRDLDLAVPEALAGGVVHGTLCVPAGARTVLVLTPGATYNSTYWDFPYQPDRYSFTRAMNRAGYATMNLDLLGTGRSSKNAGPLLTSTVEAAAVHQVVHRMRGEFQRVALAGHSLGSAIDVLEAATYGDVDALLVSGEEHRVNLADTAALFTTDLVPAPLAPGFTRTGYDLTELTTVTGRRYEAFHAPGVVDPKVVEVDEQTKDAFALAQAPDAIGIAILTAYSNRITSPVLIAMGQRDKYFCGFVTATCTTTGVLADEGPYYASARSLDAFVLPTSGHDLTLSPRAPALHTAVTNWLGRVLSG
ncbi:alpha/beta hydrolase [Amycolatopsis sp. NPDC051903]|uniref:alpha/beta hydrolase n=1 Tax=Amycolatopsis sp. NPDC051903 TaxID=3363936 RepID=UPI0037BC92CF